jgi:hypothetical protein
MNPDEQPTREEQQWMTLLGFKTLKELNDWLQEPSDPNLYLRIGPAYPEFPALQQELRESRNEETASTGQETSE